MEEMGIGMDEISFIGVATPGTANNQTGVVEYANNIPFLQYPLAANLSALMDGKPVYIENDANAAAIGEMIYGVARGMKNFIMITLGTGVGSGIVIDG
jgi:glucokinase